MYRGVLRPALFGLDAERAHGLAMHALAVAHRSPAACRALRALAGAADDGSLAVHALGRRFTSPFGVAAGLDKGAEAYNALGALGFGCVEVGTVTARAQDGNARPRLFRLPADRALLNRMGFNNPGATVVAQRLAAVPPEGVVLGVNIGKSRAASLDEAAADYAESARLLAPFAAYVVINVSSPNTPGLRSLQSVEALAPIVRAVRAAMPAPAPPLLVKIAPDLADEDIDAVTDLARAEGLAGIVATNTTLRRDGLVTPAEAVRALGDGGVSGAPLRERSAAVVARVFRRCAGELTIVGAGGVFDADDAWRLVEAGATLVQVYSGFVYQGPSLARELSAGLRARMRSEGVRDLAELRGRRAAG